MIQKSTALLGACAAALIVGAPSLAVAQEGETPIIVTATKRASTILEVPFSINAQTQEDIQRSGAGNIEDLSRNVAGLTVQNLGPGQSQVAIRGVSAGQIVRDQPGVKEQVGVYLDESVISLSLFTPDLDLFDLNRVETLRGPQGTLFGAGSVGGTIRYITNQPNLDAFEGQVEADVNTVADGGEGGHLKGAVNIPLIEGVAALRAVAYHTEYAGFIDARREGGRVEEDVNSGQRSGGRLALTIQPTANLTITPRVVYQKVEADGFNRQEVYNFLASPFTTTRPAVRFGEREQFLLLNEKFEDETLIADLSVDYDFGPVELTSVTTYTDRDILVSRDASALTNSIISTAPGVPLPSRLNDTTELEQWAQEVRLASTGEGRFQWLLGAFYTEQDRVYAQRLPTPGYDAATGTSTPGVVDSPYNSDIPYTLEQKAVFGEASYELTEALTVTAGARWYDFEESRTFQSRGGFSDNSNRSDETSSDGINPRILVSYKLNDTTTLNAQAAQGFRLGGVNDPLNVPLCTGSDIATFGGYQAYEDEKLWNYEAGLKVGDGPLTFTAAGFYTDIEDLQTTLDAGSCSSRIVFNVPSAHTAGIEFELASRVFDALEFSLAGSVQQAEFDSTVRDGSGAIIGGIEEGNRLPSVPEYQFAASATWFQPAEWAGAGSEWYINGTVQHVGSRFTQSGDQVLGAGNFVSNLPFAGATGSEVTTVDLELEEYTLLNLSAGLETGDWALIAYVRNATDENVNLSFDRERNGRARLGFATNQPRTIGITARRSF